MLIGALEGDVDSKDTLVQKGFTVSGMKFALNKIENEDDEVRYLIGRCKQYGSPSCGVIVAKTLRTIIFGLHDPIYANNNSFGKCTVCLYQLADMLIGMGF